MVRILSISIDALSSSVALIPLILLLLHIFFKSYRFIEKMWIVLFAVYLSAVFSAVGAPAINSLKVDFNFNWVPFLDIRNSPLEYIKNTVLNIILFVPFGFLLPLIWKEYRSLKRTAFMGFLLSMAIELSQIFTFRFTDIDDLITNTAGAVTGYLIAMVFLKKRKENGSANKTFSQSYEPFLIIAASFLVMFLVHPFLSEAIWNMVFESPLWETIQ